MYEAEELGEAEELDEAAEEVVGWFCWALNTSLMESSISLIQWSTSMVRPEYRGSSGEASSFLGVKWLLILALLKTFPLGGFGSGKK